MKSLAGDREDSVCEHTFGRGRKARHVHGGRQQASARGRLHRRAVQIARDRPFLETRRAPKEHANHHGKPCPAAGSGP